MQVDLLKNSNIVELELGKQITKDYKGKKPVILCLLKGSLHFMTALAESISLPIEYECLKASSYANTVSTGKVSVLINMLGSIKDKDVIIVEDIVDTGLTCQKLFEYFKNHNCASVNICTMLDKPSRRKVNIVPKYCGYEIEDYFVIGYGLDYNEAYRNIPCVGIINKK